MLEGNIKVPSCTVEYVVDLKDKAPQKITTWLYQRGITEPIYRGYLDVGDFGTAIAGVGGVAIAGERGTAIAGRFGRAFAGYEGKAKAGLHGEIEITYRSPGTSLDGHILSGLVGQDDIKADTFYRLDDQGNFVEVTL